MARRRFFVEQIRNQQAEIEGEEARHLTQVLRVEAGEKYEISDNNSVYLAQVEVARKQHVVFRVLERLPAPAARARTIVAVALIKFERLETIIEKATELGVDEIRLVEAIRSERGLEKAAGKRMARWRRIALESSQQARRQRIPELYEPVRLADAISLQATHRLLLDENRNGVPLLSAVPDLSPQSSIVVLIGPEGGWADSERDAALGGGWASVSLGDNILRTDTAAIAALAIISARKIV
jgi:16S rRNA (uracil1498-N3)-methyltransferase